MNLRRVDLVREKMAKQKLGAMLLTNLTNIRYVSGFTGSTAVVVISPDRAIIVVDSRYTLQAGQECPGYEVIQYTGDLYKFLGELIGGMGVERLGFEPENVSYAIHRKLRNAVPKTIKLATTKRLVEDIRMVKDADEIQRLRDAVALIDATFSHVVSFVKPGMKERDIALELEVFQRKNGADRVGFSTIIAAGKNAAFPHHQPTDDVTEVGQMLKMDMGTCVRGYISDLTRTIFFGEPDAKQREVYDVVRGANEAAIAAIKPGKLGKDIDSVARDYIREKGYGDYFGHGLGHGLGLEVHDGPGFSVTSETVMTPGMVFTVEPGIYIEGWGGVRIEDDVLITENGVEVLTKSTKDIVVVK